MDRLPVSVIATVRNEADNIDRLLDSLASQTLLPDQVVVVDGGSTDGTWDILTRRAESGDEALVPISRPGTNISEGRNAAIEQARGPVIVSTDAGVQLEPNWLELLTLPFASGERFVAGFFAADPHGVFETALGATTLPVADDIDPARFLPSSRSVAFRKDDWEAIGGYPEWLDFGEDLVFDIRLEHVAGRPLFVAQAVARFRPRPTWVAFLRQYYLYARGDGKADLWVWRHVIRYGVYLVAVPLVGALALTVHPMLWLVLLAGLATMVVRPYQRLIRQWGPLSASQRLLALVWVPVVRLTGDMAKMIGYPIGRLWRMKHQSPEWKPTPDAGNR